MAISTCFKKGHKIDLGRRNAIQEYHAIFTREIFEENKEDLRAVFRGLVEVAKDCENKDWLEAVKILAKHFLTTPSPEELHVSEEIQNEDSNIIVSEFLKHNFTEQEVTMFKDKIRSSYQAVIDEIVKERETRESVRAA